MALELHFFDVEGTGERREDRGKEEKEQEGRGRRGQTGRRKHPNAALGMLLWYAQNEKRCWFEILSVPVIPLSWS